MKKLLKINFYFFFFIFAVVFFIPKINLYYAAEQEMEKFAVVIDNESLKDSGFTLSITDADIYVKGINSAKIGMLNLNTYLFFNSVKIEDIVLSDTLKSFVPLKIEFVHATQAFYNPLVINLEAKGEFGEANGSVNLSSRELNVSIVPSKILSSRFRSTMKMLKKDKKGGYIYALTF